MTHTLLTIVLLAVGFTAAAAQQGQQGQQQQSSPLPPSPPQQPPQQQESQQQQQQQKGGSTGSVMEILLPNVGRFNVTLTLIEKAGLEDQLSNSDLPGTYFLPSDFAMVDSFFDYVELDPSLQDIEESYGLPTVQDILNAVAKADPAKVLDFLNRHSTAESYSTPGELAAAGTVQTLGGTTLKVSDEDGVMMVAYESEDATEFWESSVAGPGMVIPAGKAALYVLDSSVLASPAIITGIDPTVEKPTLPLPGGGSAPIAGR